MLDVAGAVPPETVHALLAACRSGAFDKAQRSVSNLVADGWLVLHLLISPTSRPYLSSQPPPPPSPAFPRPPNMRPMFRVGA